MRQLTDYLKEYPNCISGELCDEMISRFDADSRKTRGTTISGNDFAKKSTDLYFSDLPEWKDIDSQIFSALTPKIKEYLEFLHSDLRYFQGVNIHDSGYQIQCTEVGEGYTWHSDHMVKGVRSQFDKAVPMISHRIVTYIFYLNDNIEGGETQFFGDKDVSIIPEKGKLVLFPATPMYIHQGAIVTGGTKYITTGWLYSSYESLP